MIEHVFEEMAVDPHGSVIEAALSRLVERWIAGSLPEPMTSSEPGAPVVYLHPAPVDIIEYTPDIDDDDPSPTADDAGAEPAPPHPATDDDAAPGAESTPLSPETAATAQPSGLSVDVPALLSIGRAVVAGADHLDRARSLHAELARAAGAQVRSLAAFARSRPASNDRSDAEVGAAAAATRAARPPVLHAISEWAVDEISVALHLNSSVAGDLLTEALLLSERLPATLAALESGELSWLHARVVTELLGPLPDSIRATAEARLLSRLGHKTATQLRAAAHRVIARLDADALQDRVVNAIRGRQVQVHPGRDGMASLTAVLPAPVARACHAALRQLADLCLGPDDERAVGERMTDCFADLILRPGANGLPPVMAHLTVVAGVGTLTGQGPDADEPGEIDGDVIPAAMVREVAYALGLLDRPTDTDDVSADDTNENIASALTADDTDEDITAQANADHTAENVTAETTPGDIDENANAAVHSTDIENIPAGLVTDGNATDASANDPEVDIADVSDTPPDASPPRGRTDVAAPDRGHDRAERIAALGRLLNRRDTSGTALAHRPHIAFVNAVSGQLVALSDSTEIRRTATCGQRACRGGCHHSLTGRPGLGPPPETPGYRPGAGLDRFVRLRDRRCRFPGCRARPISCDLDHTIVWPLGPTSHDNLCCLCRHHHRLSHQAPGWQLRPCPGGGLEWTTPTGDVLRTYPPRYGADDDLRTVPTGTATGTATTATGTGTGPAPPDAPPPPDDPPF